MCHKVEVLELYAKKIFPDFWNFGEKINCKCYVKRYKTKIKNGKVGKIMGHLLYFPLQIEYIFWKLNCLAYCKKQGHLVEAFAFEEQVGHVILEL